MESENIVHKAITQEPIGTYDFAKPTDVVREIDRGMRVYFGVDDWLAIRRKLFPDKLI